MAKGQEKCVCVGGGSGKCKRDRQTLNTDGLLDEAYQTSK